MAAFRRDQFEVLRKRMKEPKSFIQIICGPRQVGKTTLVLQLLEELDMPNHYANADEHPLSLDAWIDQQWSVARLKARSEGVSDIILALDEVQNVPQWSTAVKKNWDSDQRNDVHVKVIISGSSRLLLEQDLNESLVGRFEKTVLMHWSFREVATAFGASAEEFIWFGGYPGAYKLIQEEQRWKEYIRSSFVEPTISKDVLQLTNIRKPALLRKLFDFACHYSGQIFSYNKMLGQLLDAGNTTTLKHYLELLDSAGIALGIEKYSTSLNKSKSSSPKLQVYNTALMSSLNAYSLSEIQLNPTEWGRFVESAIGAHLANSCAASDLNLYYWRHRNREVDFVVASGSKLLAIEVKTTRARSANGMKAFQEKFSKSQLLLVGGSGMSWQEFLEMDLAGVFM